jgi:hypothetical protein
MCPSKSSIQRRIGPIVIACVLLVAGTCFAADPTVILVGDTALVPLRATLEWLGASVEYTDGRIVATKGSTSVALRVGSTEAIINGEMTSLTQSPLIRDGSTYIPLRFVAESFGAGVSYDAAARQVVVTHAGRTLSIPIAESDPVKIAIEVFRQHMVNAEGADQGYPVDHGRRPAFINPNDHEWLRHGLFCPYTQSRVRPVIDDTKWPLENAQFRQMLRDLGWQEGDPWFLYDVTHPSANAMEVIFEKWNWWTWVTLKRTAGVWMAVTVEADGEGNEGGPPFKWTVARTGSGYEFTQLQ